MTPGEPLRVCVFGGTTEARRLAEALAAASDIRVLTSLAGRTRDPLLPAGEVRIGGLGGAAGMADWLRDSRADLVVLASHPFAAVIAETAARVATELGIPLLLLRRPGWRPVAGDRWTWAESASAAASLLPRIGQRVFLTTGRQTVADFAGLDELWFLIRAIEPPEPPLPARHHLLLDRGPYLLDRELDLMRDHRVDVVVTKDSGGEATAAKLAAARRLKLPCLLISRPPPPAVPHVETVEAALAWIRRFGG